MQFESMGSRVYDALATLRNLSDEFASFEVQEGDKKKKKLYTECRKHISKVVEELESNILGNGEHGGLDMGIYTGGTINTTTSLMNRGEGRDEESLHISEVRDAENTGMPGVGPTYGGTRKKY